MRTIDALEIALNTFLTNKMRTFLTMLGVSIGIGAIVFLVSLGYGLQELTINKITSVAALITYDVNAEGSSIIKIDDGMIDKMSKIPGVDRAIPLYSVSSQIGLNDTWIDATSYGANKEYLDLEAPKLTSGKTYNNDDNKVLITKSIVDSLGIADSEMIGKKIKVNLFVAANNNNPEDVTIVEKDLEVSGIIDEKSISFVYLPMSQFSNENKIYSAAKVEAKNKDVMSSIRAELEGIGLKVSSVGDTVIQLDKVFSIAKITLLVFGLVALIVAAIGMFNTLTISLLERTREIGIMKALGSTDKFIRKMFILEAVIIGSAGGLWGLGTGWLLGQVINILINILAKSLGGEPVTLFVTPLIFVVAVIVLSFFIGLVTGIYPARRAARLNPLDALRYE